MEKTQINGSMYHAHGQEELTSLKCPYWNQSNLQIQSLSNPYQNTNGTFYRTKTNSPKIYMEPQKTSNNHSNLEKEEQSWRYYATWYQTILQGYTNQNIMVLA